jgi:hypothetical protein
MNLIEYQIYQDLDRLANNTYIPKGSHSYKLALQLIHTHSVPHLDIFFFPLRLSSLPIYGSRRYDYYAPYQKSQVITHIPMLKSQLRKLPLNNNLMSLTTGRLFTTTQDPNYLDTLLGKIISLYPHLYLTYQKSPINDPNTLTHP